ncbi:solute carrier family 2, facilitated glucose transporter member 8-like isoform X1 [Panulirus ornatus]|uniref:solute carrier family 2, facilitated glucose transporter member 8-like isoform X1 n=1 Tax=Panulirus ornatus TaxID=150431 RepID=UPI003A8C18A6
MQQLHKSTTDLVEGSSPSSITQYYTALSACMGALALGTVMGYSSPAGPHLLSNSTQEWLQLSQEQYNWFSSSPNLGAAAGGLAGGPIINLLGRRGTIMASVLPCLVGWALIGGGQTFIMLLCGRVLTGICGGLTCVAVPAYIGEFASADVRGSLGSGFQLMITVGVVYAYVLGTAVGTWRQMALACVLPSALCFLMLLFTHESPVYLLYKGKDVAAAAALQYFRGPSYDTNTELKVLQQSVEDIHKREASLADLLKPGNVKPFIICLSLLLFSQFSGVTPIIFNMATVFKDSGFAYSEDSGALVVGLVQVVATAGAALIMDRVGRRPLLLMSAALMTLSTGSLGVYFWLRMTEGRVWTAEWLGWLPLSSLILLLAAFSLGLGPVPWLMMGEVLPYEVKEAGGSVVTMLSRMAAFTITLIYLPLQEALGEHGVFWLFSGVCLLTLAFTLLVVPETRGKTLQEIREDFRSTSTIISLNICASRITNPHQATRGGAVNQALEHTV